ncbi:MAG: glycoside hydrolase family 66 protein [Lachnospiraceae bacterium]|nr:glycoside hydrolase family 66 protein [Lachnospiraceae bacterium]MDE6619591.1 glycoside hydrolase family 66 protein [Lachnospiraceae bacterium]
MTVKYYTDKVITEVHVASFSMDGGLGRELAFAQGEDANGRYLSFTVPILEYWDMVYMK